MSPLQILGTKQSQTCIHPMYIFKKCLMTKFLMIGIVQFTNLYSTQKSGSSINLSKSELLDFISILLLMGIIDLPQYTDYWSKYIRCRKQNVFEAI